VYTPASQFWLAGVSLFSDIVFFELPPPSEQITFPHQSKNRANEFGLFAITRRRFKPTAKQGGNSMNRIGENWLERGLVRFGAQ